MSSSIFTCDSDVRIDRPYPEDDRMWALWAYQDCTDFDMILTVILDEVAQANLIGYLGVEETETGCFKADYLAPGII